MRIVEPSLEIDSGWAAVWAGCAGWAGWYPSTTRLRGLGVAVKCQGGATDVSCLVSVTGFTHADQVLAHGTVSDLDSKKAILTRYWSRWRVLPFFPLAELSVLVIMSSRLARDRQETEES